MNTWDQGYWFYCLLVRKRRVFVFVASSSAPAVWVDTDGLTTRQRSFGGGGVLFTYWTAEARSDVRKPGHPRRPWKPPRSSLLGFGDLQHGIGIRLRSRVRLWPRCWTLSHRTRLFVLNGMHRVTKHSVHACTGRCIVHSDGSNATRDGTGTGFAHDATITKGGAAGSVPLELRHSEILPSLESQ